MTCEQLVRKHNIRNIIFFFSPCLAWLFNIGLWASMYGNEIIQTRAYVIAFLLFISALGLFLYEERYALFGCLVSFDISLYGVPINGYCFNDGIISLGILLFFLFAWVYCLIDYQDLVVELIKINCEKIENIINKK